MSEKQLLSEVERIKMQIVDHYQPEKIILFGSLARGNFHKDSDIDLLVIKRTSDDPIRRIQKLSRIIDRKLAFELLVFTPDELKERLELGDFFFEEIVTKGKLLYEKQ